MMMKTGSCLCGSVKYEAHNLRDIIACHCEQCRKQTGHFMMATAAADVDFKLTEDRGLKWYRSSPTAQRGFCSDCGSVMFWRGDGKDYTAITAGSIDGPTGLKLSGHIFCNSAGDYYTISGGDFQKGKW
jgi:hypothetical protein